MWKVKGIYDRTLRRISLVHPFVRSFAWGASTFILWFGQKLLRFELPPGNIAPWFKLLWILGRYEREVVTTYTMLVKPKSIVVDVGAHAGYHTLRLAYLVGPEGKVFSFEPSPITFEVLRRNVMRRRLANVVMERKAVADYTGDCKMHIFPAHSRGKWSTQDSLIRYSDIQTPLVVPCTTLDEYFSQLGVIPDLIKVDVEGAEPLVLSGMRCLLSEASDMVLIMEFYPQLISWSGIEPSKALDTLSREGFKIFKICRNSKIIPDPGRFDKHFL